MRIDRLVNDAAKQIEQSASSDSAKLDAELLLASIIKKPRSYLFAYPEIELNTNDISAYGALVTRRVAGEPIAYILGEKEFWSISLEVGEGVLIPRPDTECLVEAVLQLPLADDAMVVDLGTGSGAIVLSLASEKPSWTLLATDLQQQALQIAAKNHKRQLQLAKANNVTLLQASWMSAFASNSFDLVVSNPPYIDKSDRHLTQGDVRFEPRSALVSGSDGLADIELIAEQACCCLKPNGYLVVEHGYQQADAVCELLAKKSYKNINSQQDYAQKPRFVVAQY